MCVRMGHPPVSVCGGGRCLSGGVGHPLVSGEMSPHGSLCVWGGESHSSQCGGGLCRSVCVCVTPPTPAGGGVRGPHQSVCVGCGGPMPVNGGGRPTPISVCVCRGPTQVSVCVGGVPLTSSCVWGHPPVTWGVPHGSVCACVWVPLGSMGWGGTHQSFGGPTWVSVCVCGSHLGQCGGGHPPVGWGVPHGLVCVWGAPTWVNGGGAPISHLRGPTWVSVCLWGSSGQCGGVPHRSVCLCGAPTGVNCGGGTHQSFGGSHMDQCVSVGSQRSAWGDPHTAQCV